MDETEAANLYFDLEYEVPQGVGKQAFAVMRPRIRGVWVPRAEYERVTKAMEELVLGANARVCNSPGCRSAIIRNDDGSRRCSAGHPARWVDIAELEALQQRLASAVEPARRTITREEFDNAVRQMQFLTTNYPDGVRNIAAAWRLTVGGA